MPPRWPGSTWPRRPAPPIRCGRPGCSSDGPGLALAHPLIAGTLYTSLPAGERALRHAGAAALLASERADPERIGLHLLRTEPAREAATVATLREAARRASARGAPQSAAAYLRRAVAEPPPDAADEADVRLELGLALAAYMQPDAYDLLHEAVAAAATPVAARHDRPERRACSRADRALLGGLSRSAVRRSRRPGRIPAELRERLEAEMLVNGMVHASTLGESRSYQREHPPGPSALELWRVTAAGQGLAENRPAAQTQALLRPVLDQDALAAEPGSLVATLTTILLIVDDELDDRAGAVRRAHRHRAAARLADRARARLHVQGDGAGPGG